MNSYNLFCTRSGGREMSVRVVYNSLQLLSFRDKFLNAWSHGSVLCIAAMLRHGWSRNRGWFQAWARDFSLFKSIQTDSGAHVASYSPVVGTLFPGVNLPESEAEHMPSSVAVFKNEWNYNFVFSYDFITTLHFRGAAILLKLSLSSCIISWNLTFKA
jgi:hypothetical protein